MGSAKTISGPRKAKSFFRRRPITSTILLLAACGLVVLGWFTAVHWPYRYREIHPLLIQVFGSQVKVANYHRVYLPYPGFVATGITITRPSAPQQQPLGTVQTLYVRGSWADLLTLQRRVRLVEMSGVHIILPAAGSKASHQDFPSGSAKGFSGPDTAIALLRLHNSILEVQHDGGQSLRFAIRSLEFTNFEKGRATGYVLDMENPMPAGHISATGSFGPLNARDVGATPVSGRFTFNQVKLTDIGELHGTLASTGSFRGPLRAIQASAVSDTPDFAVSDGRPTPVRGAINCTVNGLNGDVYFQSVEVKNGRTTIRAHGQVAGAPKITNIDLVVDNGRAEELLRPFMHEPVPVIGFASLHAHAWVGPTGKPFLQRLRVTGSFDLPSALAVKADVEQSLSSFSAREQNNAPGAKGKPQDASHQPAGQNAGEPDVLSSLAGPVTIRNGIIATPDLLFAIPGAHVRLSGTFNLDSEAVHLTGTLKMDADISHATTGWKSVLMKAFSPFFKRKQHSGSQIPIAVLGTPNHYRVVQDISRTK